MKGKMSLEKNLTPDEMLLKAMRQFTEIHLTPIADELDENDRFPVEILNVMQREKFFGISYPEIYGGCGLNYHTAYDAIAELAKSSAGVSLMLTVHWMAVDTLLKYGTDVQRQKYLPAMLNGEKIAAYSISEVLAGSDAAGIDMTAVKHGREWMLNGSKYFVTNGAIADLFVVLCKEKHEEASDSASGSHRSTFRLFIVDRDTKGLSITKDIAKMGCRSSSTTNLILKNVSVSEDDLVDGGIKAALHGLIGGRMGMAAMGIGISEAALTVALRYSKKRLAYGRPIAKLYAIQEKLADMHIAVEGSKALLARACSQREQGIDYSMGACIAKVSSAKTAMETCFQAIQILGGHGYTKDYPVERYARDARLMDIGVGTSEVMRMLIGTEILRGQL